MPATSRPHEPHRIQASRRRVAAAAHWLDNAIGIPGTRFRFGLDSLIGLIPGIGDAAGMLVGGAILVEGLRMGAPNALMLRMAGNTALDGLVGAVPVLGDAFDFAFRSNSKNARLLLAHLDTLDPQAAATLPQVRRSPLLWGLALVPLALLGLAMYGLMMLFRHF